MDSLGVLLVAPMNTYLEQELDRRCRLFRLWESPADRRDDYLRLITQAVCTYSSASNLYTITP